MQTPIGIASPDLDGSADYKFCLTRCTVCGRRVFVITSADGSLTLCAIGGEDPASSEVISTLSVSSPFALLDVVRIPPSIWQPRAALVGSFNHRPEWKEELARALQRRQDNPRPLSLPRHVFVSYRWGTPESDSWVAQLAHLLAECGNEVVFDRTESFPTGDLPIPELVSRIADCHFFIAVLDAGYIERITPQSRGEAPEGWVWDEFQTALSLSEAGIVQLIGFLRDDTPLPTFFRVFRPRMQGNTFDVRSRGALKATVDLYFAQTGSLPSEEVANQASTALHRSVIAEKTGNMQEAYHHAKQSARLVPELPDGHVRLALMSYRTLRIDEALAAAERAVELYPGNDSALIVAAAAAADLSRWKQCMCISRIILERDSGNHNARYILGRGLNAVGQVDAAIAHLDVARMAMGHPPQIGNEAGTAYRRAVFWGRCF